MIIVLGINMETLEEKYGYPNKRLFRTMCEMRMLIYLFELI